MGRPSIYSDEIVTEICARLAAGEPLTKICQAENKPDLSTVYRWISSNEDFRNRYTRAREDQADTLADEIIRISDEQPASNEHGIDAASVNHQRLRVDARKWIASKLKPKKYGDKTEVEHTGDLKIGVVSYASTHDPA